MSEGYLSELSRGFIRDRPIQTGKLAAVVVTLPYASAVFFGLISDPGVTSLFLVPLLGLGLALAVAAETLLVGYRSIRAERPLSGRSAEHPMYGVVRALEVLVVVLSVGAFLYVLGTIPEGPMSGPGAIGLWLIMVWLALPIIGASLVRSLTEYYYYRRDFDG